MVLTARALTQQPAAERVTCGDGGQHSNATGDVVVVVVSRERSVARNELGGLEIGDGLPAARTGVLTRARAATGGSHADRSNSDARREPATVTPSSRSESTRGSPERSCLRRSRLDQSSTCSRFPVQRWTAVRSSCTWRTPSRLAAACARTGAPAADQHRCPHPRLVGQPTRTEPPIRVQDPSPRMRSSDVGAVRDRHPARPPPRRTADARG